MTLLRSNSPPLTPPQNFSLPASVLKCGTGSILGVRKDSETAVIIPTTCKSWHCPKCKIPKALRVIERICSGNPERMITLTCDPKTVATPSAGIDVMKKAWARLVKKIRIVFGEFQYALVWERTKRGWPHLHAACRGTYIPQAWLRHWWLIYSGALITHIEKINDERHASRYLGKYFTKDQGPILALLGHRKLIQFSKAWSLRDVKSAGCLVPSDFTWFRLPSGMAAAVQEMIRSHHRLCNPEGKGNMSWFLLSSTEVIPGTDGHTYESLSALHPPPYKGRSPPSPVLGGPPLQEH